MCATVQTIRILAFRGVGPKYASLLDTGDDPLLIVGHVGLQFDQPPVYGFHPPTWAIEAAGGSQAALERLRNHKDIPGTIQDDTVIFQRAFELSLRRITAMGDRLVVYAMGYECEDGEFARIRDHYLGWYTHAEVLPYGWPPIEDETPYDNCATIQRRAQMPIVDFDWHKGWMSYYMRIFQALGIRWTPDQ